ncbi:TIGR03086 family metal-binding protein [Nocardioides mesophilus]|uniref:TIGR03086 family protein n=1 Tax=Nocardioides mesophilus TaxID=433659 RepID=A0A7G9RBI7_9ACTN|nr:TIGR03086 family metal-binding protein [Nocardioides mesophilus]QNN52962.1 TIGR03086 family protein [Nocardioides mesophilus]
MIDHLAIALDHTSTVMHAVTDDQWTAPTPCHGWDVRHEANHLVGGLRIYTAQLTGDSTGYDHDGTDWLGNDPAAAYDAAATTDLGAWLRPGAMDTVFDLAFGRVPAEMSLVVHITEVLVHGLDLAVAIGHEELADGELSSWLLGLMRGMGTDSFRVPGIFDAERPAQPGAPAHRELLRYLGRDIAAVPA